jgi:hypothetical protein
MNPENRVVRQKRGNEQHRTAVRTITPKAVRNRRNACGTAVSCGTGSPSKTVSKTVFLGAYRTTSFTRGSKWYDRGQLRHLWCFPLAISRPHISALTGPTVAVDAGQHKAGAMTAWSGSNQSTGLQGPADTKTAHGHRQKPLASTSFAPAIASRQRLVSMIAAPEGITRGEACSSAAREDRGRPSIPRELSRDPTPPPGPPKKTRSSAALHPLPRATCAQHPEPKLNFSPKQFAKILEIRIFGRKLLAADVLGLGDE